VLENTEVSPSLLRVDASRPVRVSLLYDIGSGEMALTKLAGIVGNEIDLPADEVTLVWDFAGEPGIGTSEYRPDVHLVAKIGGKAICGGDITLVLGNDALDVIAHRVGVPRSS
jgi:hypothetical protein